MTLISSFHQRAVQVARLLGRQQISTRMMSVDVSERSHDVQDPWGVDVKSVMCAPNPGSRTDFGTGCDYASARLVPPVTAEENMEDEEMIERSGVRSVREVPIESPVEMNSQESHASGRVKVRRDAHSRRFK
mmetsp:Transcript_5994/g.9203  ORF Transcript_5994/g.9203 Transcript_5994/m.9203 type:complete len:132 (-) Transcript_5994:450-845(-)|eukprot:CAMPEP_0184644344 /NCGR_PEP_ID=MMETSP0308-20130426/1073_1 /TAXON_ID=38269 /ORGANISM="Gloeochaete witrockiana, Strain SAG 46.84" /LENGTH=131 /DNA_ID=CAMNT_0027072815 /DNA_START=68 /DNA_END=463 /DNA_ORIENTATION=+